MMNTAPIDELLNGLPARSMTTLVLGALDFVVPGQWHNHRDFAAFVKEVTGETRIGRLDAIANHAVQLYQGPLSGCQHAVWLYQTADSSDAMLASAALAHKVGEKIGFLNFLSKVTPKEETLQCLDLAVKLSVEALAYLMIHGFKGEEVSEFARSLEGLGNENAMRMAALVCLDGILPLGPQFIDKVGGALASLAPAALERHSIFSKIAHLLPGAGTLDKLGFVRGVFEQSQGYMSRLQTVRDLSPQSLMDRLGGVIDAAQGKMELLAVFLDLTTSYVSHTGIQSVARHVITRSAERFQPK